MVDETRVRRLLRRIADDLAVLDRAAGAGAAQADDPLWLAGVKYTFVTLVEGVVDVGQHLCSSEGWGPPATNADAVRLLGTHEVIPLELARRLRLAVGFRNVLVHGYADVDDEVVLARLADLADPRAFVVAVTAWVEARSAG